MGLGLVYLQIATNRDMMFNPQPGRMIEVGGVRLHCVEHGEGPLTVDFD